MSFHQIIEKVKDYPEIWQISYPTYNLKAVKKKIWKTIARELDVEEFIIKKRWKHLLDQYRKEFRKMTESHHRRMPFTSGWQYFEPLSFLQEEMTKRNERKAEEDPGPAPDVVVWTYGNPTQEENRTPAAPPPAVPDTPSGVNLPRTPMLPNASSVNPSPAFRNPRRPNPSSLKHAQSKARCSPAKSDMILKRLQALTTSVDNLVKNEDLQNDEDYMFFQSILPMVRTLTSVQKLQLRMKINEWMLQILSLDPLQYMQGEMQDDKDDVIRQINLDQTKDGTSVS